MTVEFAAGLERHGDGPALWRLGGGAISYRELARRADAFAGRIGHERKLLAIEASHSEHSIVAYLGALRGGHVAALVSPDGIEQEAFSRRFRPDAFCRAVDGRWRITEQEGGRGAMPELHPDLALLLTTSGSTGAGKGVRLSGGALDANASAIASYLELDGSDRTALILPLHYCYGLSVPHSHLAIGASIWLDAGSVLAPGFVERLKQARATNLSGVPYSFELLERVGMRDDDLPDLRFMTVAGGRLAPDLLRIYAAHLADKGGRFFAMYGQTEATARMAYLPPQSAIARSDCIGVAIPGGELALVDAAGDVIAGSGQVGELVFRGPNVMMGYADARADLARGPELSRLHTGDLAEREADGMFRIVGRKSRMSKIAGIRLNHEALEASLAREGIAAAVVGDDRRLVAVFTSPGAPRQVREALAAASGLTLRQVDAVAVAALPRLPNGKVDLRSLAHHVERPAPEQAADVRATFAQAFFPHAVSEGDSFASLGGDSLRYVELSAGLEPHLGALPEGWEKMSVASLAALRQKDGEARSGSKSVALGLDIPVRALAIVLVVIHHATLWPISGGSSVMMLMIGYGLARFQKGVLLAQDYGRFLRPLLPVLVPYFLIVAGYALAWDAVPWASVFLVGNLGFADPATRGMLPFLYWFVEAYAQTLLVFALLFLLPPLRRLAARDAFAAGCVMLGGALALRFLQPVLWPIGPRQIFALPWVLHLAMFGWCVAFADTPRRRIAVFCIAALVMPVLAIAGGNWSGSWIRYGMVFAVVAGLCFLPRIRLPGAVAKGALVLAAAGYHIYLLHRFVPELLLAPWESDLPPWLMAVLAISGGIALGLAAFRLQRLALRLLARWWARQQPTPLEA